MAIGDQSDMLSRLKSYLPRWFGDSSPFIDGVMTGFAYVASFIFSLYQYAANQTRIKTATDGFLDMIAADFFGTTIARVVGQADGSFRAKIIANMFRERGTRYGMTKMLLDVTGRNATCVEPGNPGQVGAYSTPTVDTRSSTGTYYDSNGILQTAPAYTPRFSYNPANLSAAPTLLIEGAATNLLKHSNAIGGTGWNVRSGTIAALNSGTGADGSQTATLVTQTSGDGYIWVSSPGIQSGTFTLSVWAESAGGSPTISFHANPAGTTLPILLTSNLQRYTYTFTLSSNSSDLGFYIQGSAIVWGAQLETGSVATSYIATGSSTASRAADVVTQGNVGSVCGYGVAGAWGTVQYPGTVLITAYLPNGSSGVAAGSLTAQDIYNAVEAVRPIGSTCWVSVQS